MLTQLLEYLKKPGTGKAVTARDHANNRPKGKLDLQRDLFVDARKVSHINVVDDDLINNLAPSVLVVERDHVCIGNLVARFFYLSTQWPSGFSRPTWQKLMSFSGSLSVSIHVDVVPPAIAAHALRSENSALITKQYYRLLNRRLPDSVDSVRGQILEQNRMQTELMGEPLLYVTVVLGLFAPDKEILNAQTKTLMTLIQQLGLRAYRADFQQLQGLLSSMPVLENPLRDHRRNISTESMAKMFPRINQEIVHPRGFLLGRDLSNGAAVVVDPYNLTNPTMLIMGLPGSGKSYLMKSIIEQAVIAGVRCFALDIEGEYIELARSLGGIYLDMALNSKHKVNILDIDPHDPEGMAGGYQDFYAWVIALLGRPLHPTENEALNKAYVLAFAQRGIFQNRPETYTLPAPTLSDLLHALNAVKMRDGLSNQALALACDNLHGALYNYASGVLAPAFNCVSNINIASNPFVVFGLKNAGDDTVKALRIRQVQIWLWNKVLNDQRRKMVVVDEGWFFMQHESAAHSLEEWARRMRKKNAALLIGTQFIDDFMRSTAANAILNIAETRIYGRVPPTAVDQVGNKGKLTETERATLATLQPGQFILHAGNVRRLIYNEVPRERHMVYTTKPSDFGL